MDSLGDHHLSCFLYLPPNHISHFFNVVIGNSCAWMAWGIIIFHAFSAFRKLFVPFKHACTRHAIFTVSLSQWLKSFRCGFLQFNKKLDVNSLFTFAVWHFPRKDKNTPIFEDASTCTEYSNRAEPCNTVTGQKMFYSHLFVSPLPLLVPEL